MKKVGGLVREFFLEWRFENWFRWRNGIHARENRTKVQVPNEGGVRLQERSFCFQQIPSVHNPNEAKKMHIARRES